MRDIAKELYNEPSGIDQVVYLLAFNTYSTFSHLSKLSGVQVHTVFTLKNCLNFS
jgi:hypothetical protein